MRTIAIVMLMFFILPMIVMAAVPVSTGTTNDDVGIISTYDEISSTAPTTKIKATEPTTFATETMVIDTNYHSDTPTFDELNIDYYHDLLARAIYCESGVCGEYCQWLVGSAILNLADERGGIENVVFDYDTINVAYVLYDCTPSDLSYVVAKRLLDGDRDYEVRYFRTGYYHGFGTPYTNADNVYFSTK